jgi:hypothetical protein
MDDVNFALSVNFHAQIGTGPVICQISLRKFIWHSPCCKVFAMKDTMTPSSFVAGSLAEAPVNSRFDSSSLFQGIPENEEVRRRPEIAVLEWEARSYRLAVQHNKN